MEPGRTYWEWLFGFYGDCVRKDSGHHGRLHYDEPPWLASLLDFKSCAALHIDVFLAIPLVVVLILLGARRLGWINLHPRDIVFFVVCLGLAPLYFLAFWEPGWPASVVVGGIAMFVFPAVILLVIGIVALIYRRAFQPISTIALAGVLLLALAGHGCVHALSYTGI